MPSIPYKYAIPILVIIPISVWIIGTHKYDFMTPKEIPANKLRPDFASPVNREIADSVTARHPPLSEPETPPLPKIEMGNLQTSPDLDEYLLDSESGSAALLHLATRLLQAGQVQRAILAYERILDSTPHESTHRTEAETSLQNLKPSLPLWNPDPSAALPLTINLSTARDPESLSQSLLTLTKLIRAGSGNLCQPKFQINSAPKPTVELPSLPIALWLTIPGEDAEKPSLAIVSVSPQSKDDLEDALIRALFQMLQSRIQTIGNLTTPIFPNNNPSPQNALLNRITRLAWKQVLQTPFQSLEKGPLAENGEKNAEPAEPSSPSPEEERIENPDS